MEVLKVIGREHNLRILLLLRSAGPLRFSDIERTLDMNPAQVDRALRFLRKGMWIVASTPVTVRVPGQGRIPVQYELGERAKGVLQAFDAFSKEVDVRRADIGAAAVDEVLVLYPSGQLASR